MSEARFPRRAHLPAGRAEAGPCRSYGSGGARRAAEERRRGDGEGRWDEECWRLRCSSIACPFQEPRAPHHRHRWAEAKEFGLMVTVLAIVFILVRRERI